MSGPNFEELMRNAKDDIINYWNFELSYCANIYNLIGQTVFLPEKDIQLPILTCYAVIPSALCLVLPIMVIHGPSGCSKSDLMKLLAGIQGRNLLGSDSTPVSIRNEAANGRWSNPEEQAGEKNFCLYMDNLNENTLNSNFLYGLLLNGYDRDTDTIKIAQEGGKNKAFHVFGPKVISSIHNLFSYPKFSELKRRILLIKLREGEKIDAEAFNDWLPKRLPIGMLDLKYLKQEYEGFWHNVDNCERFLEIRKKLQKPKQFDSHKWIVSRDLIAIGLAIGLWESKIEAFFAFSTYWQWITQFTAKEGAIKMLINAYIDELRPHWEKGITQAISCDELKKKVNMWVSQGKTEYLPRQSDLVSIMLELGWQLDRIQPSFATHVDTYWVPID